LISDSPDLKYWGNLDLLLAVKDIPFSNLKIGPAAPPVKTQKGWLTTFHTANFDPARRENGEPRPGDAIYDHSKERT
jgi:beta-1,4-mannooligosaccharide/beta-1,4-mannosyl-N-acetylglucosamine phosphorylase